MRVIALILTCLFGSVAFSQSERIFDASLISEIYIPEKPYDWPNYPAFVVYKNEKIRLTGDIFNSCKNIHISESNAHKKLPENCQFTLYYGDDKYVCANRDCEKIDYEFIIDMESGEEYPHRFE
ncbi:MAG: hypothetical protein FWD15_02910 [Alphaproteobacteria bacterium]|nr:hypothetical protein [Alphaproteobacteria bacterium]